MDNSISIPNNLVIRSLPVNVELLELLKTSRRVQNPSQIEVSAISHNARAQQRRGVAVDIDDHMSAFDVEEFVREYEKEILQRL